MSRDDVLGDPDRQEFDAGALGPPPADDPDDPGERRHEAAENIAVPGDDLTGSLDEATGGEPSHR
ncbi:hypothetical protein [Catenuloplanes atrovinosus]|uniref:Uncharacterized protein n=1 Tax=Catenuloplanes atrovinosus TaxID=137266 RepID=A0AAE3YNH2_9ACTN|nr:hypothetical protein [Catenuloplanes atrovinosus]MDR7277054.1 hypothetical protein [Catenuloplanes atrovinosus]